MQRAHVVDNLNQYEDVATSVYAGNEGGKNKAEVNDNVTIPPSSNPTFSRPHSPNAPVETFTGKQLVFGGIIHPSTYSGDTAPQIWLREYELIAEGNGWCPVMKSKKIIGYLKDAARAWYFDKTSKKSNLTWEEIKTGLKEQFSNTCDHFMSEERIARRKQIRNETFEMYWYSKLELIQSLDPEMSENKKMTSLINGFNPQLNAKVLERVALKPCKNLTELFQLAKSLNDVTNFISSGDFSKKPRQVSFTELETSELKTAKDFKDQELSSLTKAVNDLKATLLNNERLLKKQNWQNQANPTKKDWREEKNQQKNGNGKTTAKKDFDKSKIRCFACNEMGHFANECKNKSKDDKMVPSALNEKR